ncbi:MAG: glycosyltransferase family 2 protein, partial [Chloroflexi bacterium]|nr:glycosyltransferase family 2 protein [Chloroflexota bacterium]
DADDWIYPECLERMVSVAEQHPSVGVVSAYRLYADRVDLDGIIPYWQTFVHGRDVVRQAMLAPAWRGWITGSPTSLLFRRDLVARSPEFYDRRFWHSDTDATFRLLLESDLGFVHQVLTFTRCSRPGSLMNITDRVNSFKPQEGRLLVRYGPKVLNRAEYRRRLHRWLAAYAWYLGSQRLKPSRRSDQEFHAFHQREIDYLLEEAGDDYELRAALWALRGLLARRTALDNQARSNENIPAAISSAA